MLAWQSLLYFCILHLAASLGLHRLVAAFKPELEWLTSYMTGTIILAIS